jgi:YD repeat-containing protein
VRVPAAGPLRSYELRMPDGGRQVFGLIDGAAAGPRRVFLTEIIDAAGNAVVLRYDDRLRLRALRDAAGRLTRLAYEQRDNPLVVTRITDPFGRASTITYTADGHLGWSTNTTGLTSSFTYDEAGLVTSMTTPYGTTRASHGRTAGGARFLEIIDPMGFSERVESAPTTAGPGLYWDKHVLPTAPTATPSSTRSTWPARSFAPPTTASA